jgi:hypothetical protein
VPVVFFFLFFLGLSSPHCSFRFLFEVPSGRPTIIKATNTSATSIFLRWAAPPSSTFHGEFLGYQLTYEERYAPPDESSGAVRPSAAASGDVGAGVFGRDGIAGGDEDVESANGDGRPPPEVVDIKGPGISVSPFIQSFNLPFYLIGNAQNNKRKTSPFCPLQQLKWR